MRSGKPRTVRVVGTLDRPNRTGNDRDTSPASVSRTEFRNPKDRTSSEHPSCGLLCEVSPNLKIQRTCNGILTDFRREIALRGLGQKLRPGPDLHHRERDRNRGPHLRKNPLSLSRFSLSSRLGRLFFSLSFRKRGSLREARGTITLLKKRDDAFWTITRRPWVCQRRTGSSSCTGTRSRR